MTQGILNVLKPPGMTSHDIVSFVRKAYKLKRVGHAGTLDPAAAGVLPVFLGQATRLIEYQADADKSYRAELTFGYATDTGDDTGRIIEQASFKLPELEKITDCLSSFQGVIKQIPPMYSAIKVNGQKLYDLARAGITIERESREVLIHSIKLVTITDSTLLFDVTCSKGTYIRTLCIDIGQALNIPAVMSFLVRTRVGSFHLQDAYSLEEISCSAESILLPQEKAVDHLDCVHVNQADSLAFRNGRSILMPTSNAKSNLLRIYDDRNIFIGIATAQGQVLTPKKVFHPE